MRHELQPLSRRPNRQGIGPNGQEAGRDAQRVDPQGAARMAGQEDAWQSRLAVADSEMAGRSDTPPFESYRGELLPPREDAFS